MSQFDDLYEIEDKPKRKRYEDPTTWADAWKAIGIFVVITMLVSLSLSFTYVTLLGEKFETYIDITLNASGYQNAGSDFFSSYMGAFQNPLFLVLYTVLAAILAVIALFIIYGLMHVFATKVLKGEGSLRGLIVRANWWTTGVYVAYSIFSALVTMRLVNVVVERYEGVNISATPASINEFSSFILSQNAALYGVGLLLWVIWGVALSFVTSENYHFEKNKGCTTLILTNVTLIALYCGCAFGIGIGFAGFMMAA